ncbi:thiolase family protein [Halobacillus kuroshimensis]|uniref:acetyl-CoA C-acetyltransferase n=1 Tax=Halobacillus kuroshimensis TaxID=302481 RepID=A0ABS3DV70_9BACI|nr:thiolase family protein [Halobacillus kuroshimensis]MBN8235249.1 thiolase family protein [Halobacillus kuroshimensis]
MNEEIVIVSAVRTPVGRYGGSLRNESSGHLASHAIKGAVSTAGLKGDDISEVILGEVRQTTESSNVARVASLRAGIPESSPAYTINRLCASGMEAIASGVQQIVFQQADIVVAGGTESMSRAPIYLRQARFGEGAPVLVDSHKEAGQQPKEMYGPDLGMGITAENVAERYGISREDQDVFALESQRRAAAAVEAGFFLDEVIPYEVKGRKGIQTIKIDEHPRPETTKEKLASLRPVFKDNGTVTAGNSCGRNDGASAVVMMTREKADEMGCVPLVKITDWAVAGVSPEVMGIGPVPAVQKLMDRTGLSLKDIRLIELNEAFAAQALAVIRELEVDSDIVNVNGGAIALGHPVGASGTRIVTTLIHEMKRRKERYGLAALCAGGGQGMAMLFERV